MEVDAVYVRKKLKDDSPNIEVDGNTLKFPHRKDDTDLRFPFHSVGTFEEAELLKPDFLTNAQDDQIIFVSSASSTLKCNVILHLLFNFSLSQEWTEWFFFEAREGDEVWDFVTNTSTTERTFHAKERKDSALDGYYKMLLKPEKPALDRIHDRTWVLTFKNASAGGRLLTIVQLPTLKHIGRGNSCDVLLMQWHVLLQSGIKNNSHALWRSIRYENDIGPSTHIRFVFCPDEVSAYDQTDEQHYERNRSILQYASSLTGFEEEAVINAEFAIEEYHRIQKEYKLLWWENDKMSIRDNKIQDKMVKWKEDWTERLQQAYTEKIDSAEKAEKYRIQTDKIRREKRLLAKNHENDKKHLEDVCQQRKKEIAGNFKAMKTMEDRHRAELIAHYAKYNGSLEHLTSECDTLGLEFAQISENELREKLSKVEYEKDNQKSTAEHELQLCKQEAEKHENMIRQQWSGDVKTKTAEFNAKRKNLKERCIRKLGEKDIALKNSEEKFEKLLVENKLVKESLKVQKREHLQAKQEADLHRVTIKACEARLRRAQWRDEMDMQQVQDVEKKYKDTLEEWIKKFEAERETFHDRETSLNNEAIELKRQISALEKKQESHEVNQQEKDHRIQKLTEERDRQALDETALKEHLKEAREKEVEARQETLGVKTDLRLVKETNERLEAAANGFEERLKSAKDLIKQEHQFAETKLKDRFEFDIQSVRSEREELSEIFNKERTEWARAEEILKQEVEKCKKQLDEETLKMHKKERQNQKIIAERDVTTKDLKDQLDLLEKRFKVFQASCHKLHQERKSQQDSVKEAKDSAYHHSDQAEQLQSDLKKAQSGLETANASIKDLQEKRDEILEDFKNQKKELRMRDQQILELKKTEGELEGSVEDLQKELKKTKDSLNKLKLEHVTLTQTDKNTLKRLEEVKQRYKQKNNEFQELEQDSKACLVKNKLLQEDKARQIERVKEAHQRRDVYTTEIERLTKTSESLENSNSELLTSKGILESQLKELRKKFAKAQSELDTLKNVKSHLENDNQDLKERNCALTKEKLALTKETTAQKSQLQQLENRINEQTEQIQTLNEHNCNKNKENQEKARTIEKLENDLKNQKAKNKQHEKTIREQKKQVKEVAKVRAQAKKTRQELDTAKDNISNLESEAENLKMKKDELVQKNGDLESEIQDLTEEKNSMSSKIKSVKSERDKYKKTLTAEKKKVEVCTEAEQKWNSKYNRAQNDNKELQKRHDELRKSNDELGKRNDELRKRNEELEEQDDANETQILNRTMNKNDSENEGHWDREKRNLSSFPSSERERRSRPNPSLNHSRRRPRSTSSSRSESPKRRRPNPKESDGSEHISESPKRRPNPRDSDGSEHS